MEVVVQIIISPLKRTFSEGKVAKLILIISLFQNMRKSTKFIAQQSIFLCSIYSSKRACYCLLHKCRFMTYYLQCAVNFPETFTVHSLDKEIKAY